MPIAINGSGTITGISAGGLPDGCITTDDLAGSIADAKLSGTTCKAWVNFNGTGTVAIRASYNVSSITDNGVGDYTVNFATAMASASYAVVGTCGPSPGINRIGCLTSYPFDGSASYLTTSVRIGTASGAGGNPTQGSVMIDSDYVHVAIFR